MPRSLIFVGCWGFILWLLARDARKRPGITAGIWIVVFWVAIIASRSVSAWFGIGGGADLAKAYDEGNALERMVYFALIGAGMVVLKRRGTNVHLFLQQNKWLVALFGYWLASALWSDYPMVAYKRLFKDAGNVVMALVILTEPKPVEAMKAVFARCACVLLPLSILFIRFVPDMGRSYHPWSGAMMYTGVATHKNTLGALVLVSGLFLLWDFLTRARRIRINKDVIADLALIALAAYLVVVSRSATSLAAATLGTILLFVTRLGYVRRNIQLVTGCALAAVIGFVVMDAAFGIRETVSKNVLEALDRDPTLTGRTDAWGLLVKEVENPWLGTGYNSFWAGDRLRRMWEHYDIIQAHNGYVEVYLNGGVFGVTFLLAFLLATARRLYAGLLLKREDAYIRMILLLIVIMHNFTEASFNKMSMLWFVMLLISINYPQRRVVEESARATAETPQFIGNQQQGVLCVQPG